MSRVLRRLSAALLVAALVLTGCGDSDAAPVAPAAVPDDLVPDRLDGLLVLENREESTLEALANPGRNTLVSDTRIYEIRRGDRLVGTLQISTVLPDVDLTDGDVRDRFVGQVILGQFTRRRIGDVEVFTTSSDDKTVAVWFGAELFQVVQTKDRELDPEVLLTSIIDHQDGQEGWVPLPQLLEFED